MNFMLHMRSVGVRLKLRLMIDEAADIRASLAAAPRGSEAWVLLKEHSRILDNEIREAGDKLCFMGYEMPMPMGRVEMSLIAVALVGAGIAALGIILLVGPQ